MNFHLSGLFQNQNTTDQVYNTSDSKETLTASANRQVALAGLQPGSSITGTVVSTEDGTITIKLADESVLMASLKQDISLNPGAVVSFLVQSNHNNQITLNPLFTNVMGASKNIENALQAASLPINETTTAMVSQMMKQGMSIDKGSLMNMYREIMANPDIDAGTAVRLSNMNLAINELNAENLKMYDSMNHQLMEGIGDITDELQNVMSGLSIKSPDQAATLFRQVVDLFLPGTAATEITDMPTDHGEIMQTQADVSGGYSMPADNPGEKSYAVSSQLSDISKLISDYLIAEKDGNGDNPAAPVFKMPETVDDALKLIANLSEHHKIDSKILSEPSIGQLIKQKLEENWLLKPEGVADKEKVEAYYGRLRTQTAQLSQLLEVTTGKESALTQKAGQLSGNIDFINQLNQTFTYIQIPLKMSGQNANGDLYVYSNKKSLAAKDGTVSAYLHLDMDHLGSVDCYVTMRDDHVTTNFKVRDDEVLDLIEQNIGWLDERLQKRGYHLQSTVSVSDEETSVIQEMEKQLGVGSVPISKVSFDARA